MGNVNGNNRPDKMSVYSRAQLFNRFDPTKYVGDWWEVVRCNNLYERGCERSRAQYGLIDANTISVTNFCYAEGVSIQSINGSANVVNPRDPASLHVRFDGVPDLFPNQPNYVVYETDYDNYAIVYSPEILGSGMGRCLWILSRHKEISPDDYTYLLGRVQAQGLDTSLIQFQDNGAVNADAPNRLVPNVSA